MAMTLRLSDEQTEALRKAASEDGISMQEAALQAVDAYLAKRAARLASAIELVRTQDAELLKRLAH